jgi:ATP-binding cassette subfamily B protein
MRLLRKRGSADAVRAVLRFTSHHWRRQAGRASAIACAMLLATLADILVPVFAGELVDAVATRGHSAEALSAALRAFASIIGLGLVTVVLRHLAFLGIIAFTLRIMQDVARDAFWRVQRFSTEWQANSFAGSTVRKITRGMWALDLMHDTIVLSLLPALAVLVGSALLLGIRWPVMGAVIAIGSLAYIVMTVAMALAYVAPAARLSNSWDTKIGGALADATSCNAVVKAFGAEDREDARLTHILHRWALRTRRTWRRGSVSGTAQMAALLAMRAAVIGAAIWLWFAGKASAGDIAYVLTAFFVIQGYLREVGQHIRNLQRSVNDMEELVEIVDQPLGIEDRPGAKPITIGGGKIVFDGVGFHYGDHATPLYRGLGISIAAGEKVGLVGRSGSGKTTFVKLIQRLYEVTEGRITIDGQDIAQATQASLRSQIAIVQQEPILFHRSLYDNIAYARPGSSQEAVERAARLAHAHDFIARLPRGYATLVGERGVKLSGGERQRVALARAFLADLPILILDEATSSLDSESEALIQSAIERLMAGRTAIVIAHRLSTVQRMDRILVFDEGEVVEQGSHQALLHREGGSYRRLFEHQALGLTGGIAA